MEYYSVKNVRVIDGDTMELDIYLGWGMWMTGERLRLWNVDTPERADTEGWMMAKAYAEQRISENAERLKLYSRDERDKYGRLLGDLQLVDTQKLLGVELVEEGLGDLM